MSDLAVKSWKRLGKQDYYAARAEGAVLGESRAHRPLELARTRLIVAGAIFAICFAVLSIRLLDLSLLGAGVDPAAPQMAASDALTLERRDIVDRNGVVLATNLPTDSLYVDPAQVIDAEEAVAELATVLPDINPATILRMIGSGGRFHWIKRNLTPEQMWQINSLGLPGFSFVREERRVYPHGALFAHALGFAGVDNRGLAGIEAALDERLTGTASADAEPLTLSLDVRVQHALVDELGTAMATFQAIGAAGIVLDVQTGELVAMASLPAFDPNLPGESSADERFNRATLGVYELGSVFKAFNTAMALDYGVVDLADRYDATKPLKVSRFFIRDDHPENRWLTVPEIFIHSSNIGSARMAMDVGSDRQQAFLAELGMFDALPLELPESGRPLKPRTWRDINTMTVAYGHGVAVTPLHALNGFATLVNGGIRREPTLLRRDAEDTATAGTRVISAETSEIMRSLLYLVVAEGTGRQAHVDGYLVGGKTGTAEKARAGGYARKALLSTFIAAFPIDAPRYAVLISLDEPQGNETTHGFASAGWTAAPTTGQVIARIGPLLGVPALTAPALSPGRETAPRPPSNIVRTGIRSGERATF